MIDKFLIKSQVTLDISENPDKTDLNVNEPSHQDFQCLISKFIFMFPP